MKRALRKYQEIEDEEIEKFFNTYAIGNLLYYREQLMFLYGKQSKKLPNARNFIKKNPEQVREMRRLKVDLFNYIKKNNYTLEELFAVLDKNRNNEVTLAEMN